MSEAIWTLVGSALTLAFSAGIFYQREKKTRQDLNGVRRLLNEEIARSRQRFIYGTVVLLAMNEGKDPHFIWDYLKRGTD